jgi:hypothetical protein
MKILTTILALIFASAIMCQNIELKGIVYNNKTKKPIQDVTIAIPFTHNYIITDQLGSFTIQIPDSVTEITVVHDAYEPRLFSLKPGLNPAELKIGLTPIDLKQNESYWKSYKNAISLSALELINGALAIRYERSLHIHHSVGVHASFYLLGRNPITFGSEYDYYPRYQGVRLSPYYRFYPLCRKSFGLFAEIKGHFGYIHFSKLPYHYSSYSSYRTNMKYSFWGSGFGASTGLSLKLPRTKRGILNISIGYQYFPIDVPESIKVELGDGTVITEKTDTYWWYRGGPGTRLDIKLTIGGIF